MNADHRDAIAVYARHFAKAAGDGWVVTGFDAEGMDMAFGDEVRRMFFPEPLDDAARTQKDLVDMAKTGRVAGLNDGSTVNLSRVRTAR